MCPLQENGHWKLTNIKEGGRGGGAEEKGAAVSSIFSAFHEIEGVNDDVGVSSGRP